MKAMRGFPWLALVLVAPAFAGGQVTVSDEVTDAQRQAGPRQTLTLSSGRTTPAGTAEGVVPEFHTVNRGDTLWDITGYYFANPWRWPGVWGRNPQITNPHWIFPGDQVRLLEHAAARVVAPSQSTRLDPSQAAVALRPRVPRGTVFLREEAWASPEAIAASGTVLGAPEEQMLLSEGDTVYLQFDGRAPNVGESYTVYQEGQGTQSPDRDAGRVVRVLGTVVIDAWDRERHVATGHLTESIDPIERGERVAIVQRQFQPVSPTPNDRDLVGRIVAMPNPRIIVGGQYVVIVDRGEQDGVRLGNRLFLTRRGDPMLQNNRNNGRQVRLSIDRDGDGQIDAPPENPAPEDNTLPVEVQGELMVVAVHPRTAVCIITGSDREIEVGAPVVMRRGY
jgi:hypothetical protein